MQLIQLNYKFLCHFWYFTSLDKRHKFCICIQGSYLWKFLLVSVLCFLVSVILKSKHTFIWVRPFLMTVGFAMANLNGGKICGRNVTLTCLCWDHINCKTLIWKNIKWRLHNNVQYDAINKYITCTHCYITDTKLLLVTTIPSTTDDGRWMISCHAEKNHLQYHDHVQLLSIANNSLQCCKFNIKYFSATSLGLGTTVYWSIIFCFTTEINISLI
jgi:hypothetical protein